MKGSSGVKAAIFDMDGLLVDSEPLWRHAEIEVFGGLGVRLTEDDCRQTMGLRIDEVVRYWRDRFPWEGVADDEVADQVERAVIVRVGEAGQALPGAVEAVRFLSERVVIGLASSSSKRVIAANLAQLGLSDRFAVIASGEDELFGKPHPAIYLTAAKALGIAPTACLALEDSMNGVIAAKAARMRCIAVPAADDPNRERLGIADRVLASLIELPSAWEALLG